MDIVQVFFPGMLTVQMVLQPSKNFFSCIMRAGEWGTFMSFLLHSYFGKSLATLYAKNRIKETTLKRRTNREEGSLVFPCSKGWSFGEFLLISHFMIIRVQKVWRTSEKGVILVVSYLLKLRFEIQLPFLRSLQSVIKKSKEERFFHIIELSNLLLLIFNIFSKGNRKNYLFVRSKAK